MSRTRNSLRNASAAVTVNAVVILANLVTQRLIISELGIEVAGLNAVFVNVLSFLALAELGIGAAILYQLYAPLARGDWERVSSFIAFYRRCYLWISVIVAGLAAALLPMLGSINADGAEANLDGRVVLGLFTADIIVSYVFASRRSLLIATAQNHVVSAVHGLYIVCLLALQSAALVWTANFYVFLLARVIIRLAEGLHLEHVVRKRFPMLRRLREADSLPRPQYLETVRSVKALVLHKVGSYVVLGTDYIIVSSTLGLRQTGLYSNYVLIQTALITLVSQGFAAATSSIGNLLATKNQRDWRAVFYRVEHVNFWLAALSGAGIATTASPLISVWLGPDLSLDFQFSILLGLSTYLTLCRSALGTFKEAAGIYHQDRFVPLFEAVLNLALGLILVRWIGISGVVVATIISSMLLQLYSLPWFVWVEHMGGSYCSYILNFVKRCVQFAAVLSLAILAFGFLSPEAGWASVVSGVLGAAGSTLAVYLVSRALRIERGGVVSDIWKQARVRVD